jgi:hypothetical protein
MAVAIIYPEEMGRNSKGGKVAKNLGLSGELGSYDFRSKGRFPDPIVLL